MEQFEEQLKNRIEKELPEFVKSCKLAVKTNALKVFHQDAFACDYQAHEYLLLGMAIKYAGMFGIEVRIIGKNRETLK